MRIFAIVAAVFGFVVSAWAGFAPVSKECAKALKLTRGKPFNKGAVFIDGKFLPGPYLVERRGTGIRINGKEVTGEIVPWVEFLRTQEGFKTIRTVVEQPAAPVAAPAPAPEPVVEEEDEDTTLDDLFEDDPKPKKVKKMATASAAPAKVAAPTQQVTFSYALEGEFAHNDQTRALLAKINDARTEIDTILRRGGFICFGSGYSRVVGDERTFRAMLDVLPELMQRATSLTEFRSNVRAANLIYLNELLCEDLFRNKIDYRKLKELREKLKDDDKYRLDDIQPIVL